METTEVIDNVEVIDDAAEIIENADLDLKKLGAAGLVIGAVALGIGMGIKFSKPFVTKKLEVMKEKREAKKNSKVIEIETTVEKVDKNSDK